MDVRWKLIMLLFIMAVALSVAACADPQYGLPDLNDAAHFPARLVAIDEEAFEGTDLRAIVLPEGLEAIGERAFAGNEHLRLVLVPGSVIAIGDGAFDGASRITLLGDPGSFAEDWARDMDMPFVNRALVDPVTVPVNRFKILLPLFLILPMPEEEREKIRISLRNLRSLRRRDRPEMAIPEAVVP